INTMLILDRYFIREIFKYLGIILTAVIGIFLAIDFFEKIDDFLEAGLPIHRAAVFFMLRIPFVVAQISPLAILLSVLIVLGLMNKRNELLALRSGGVSMLFFLRSITVLGVLFAVLLFLNADILVPITFSKANRIYTREVAKEEVIASREKNIWIKGNRSISHIKYYNPSSQTISGITLYFFDEKFRLVRQVDAVKGTFKANGWLFYDILEQVLDPLSGEYKVTFHKERSEPLATRPADFKRVSKKSEEMNVLELWDYIVTVENEGYDATSYRVDLQAKIAFPFVCIILCILALGIGVNKKLKESLALVVALGIGVAFLYWTLYSFCLSLGYGGVLPPFVAAWTTNFVFFSAGVLNLLYIE
ncbi:MAG: LPS export ABC transporter permease LptG, partial [Desulfobacterales bacterium]